MIACAGVFVPAKRVAVEQKMQMDPLIGWSKGQEG